MAESVLGIDKEPIFSGRTLNIRDFNEVAALLEKHHYSKASYQHLGQYLKLSYNTLEDIKKDHKDVHSCFTECLASWLRKADDVENPTIDTLIAALRGIGENAVADGINGERQTFSFTPTSEISLPLMPTSEISNRPMLATPPTMPTSEEHPTQPIIVNPGVHDLEAKVDQVIRLRDIANKLQDKFDYLVLAMKRSLESNSIDVEDAKLLIHRCLKTKARVFSQLMPCIDILKKVKDFKSFFEFLNEYDFIGYLNYKLLKKLSELVKDDNEINRHFIEYEKEYAKLLSTASFHDLIPLFDKQSDLSPTAPLGLPYVSFCVEKPHSFTSAHDCLSTFDEFSWSQDTFLKQLQKKCIIITYAILPCILDDVSRDLKDPVILKKLEDKGVTVIQLPLEEKEYFGELGTNEKEDFEGNEEDPLIDWCHPRTTKRWGQTNPLIESTAKIEPVSRVEASSVMQITSSEGKIPTTSTDLVVNESFKDLELWFACLDGDVERANRLIKDGADIELKGQGGHSPLSIAAYSNRTEVVRLLLSSGANVDAVDEHNRSALFWSATFGSMTITKVLLDYEADMNLLTKKSRSTVLMGATSTGRLDIVQLLVSRGASWKVVNEDGLTALDVAKQEKYEHLIQYFSSLDDSESQMRKALTTDIKIKLKITRMSIHGAPGSGKTCLQHLILNEPPPLERSSTDVVTPAVRGSICGYMETDSSHSMKRVSEEEFITHLAKRLKGKEGLPSSKQHSSTYPPSTPPPPTPPSRLSSLQRAFTSLFSRTSSESSDASSPLPDSPLPTHSVHYDIISQVSTESCSEEDYRAHWTFCIDSGGHAAFQDIAPPFLRLNSLNIITLRLIDELDHQPNNEFYINGIPFPSNHPNHLTNRQIITNFARSLLSISPSSVLTSNPVPVPSLLVMGTYADRMTECSQALEDKNVLLKADLEPYKNMCTTTPEGCIIHPVNTLVTDGRREESLKLSKIITCRNKSDEVEVPFRWFCFQLEITKKAKKENFKVLTRNECLRIARTFEMESSMENALIYFDSLGMLFYYPAVLPDTVFTHPEPLLKTLTTLVYITFADNLSSHHSLHYNLHPHSHERLKEDGVFDLEVVKCLDEKFAACTASSSFSAEDFIDLLLHLLIVCQLPGNSQYFIPCVLPWSALSQEEERDYRKVIDPIALAWGNGSQPVPYGLFTGLVNSLISGRSFSLISMDFKQRRNAIGLEYNKKGWLVLLDRICFIEAFFTGPPNLCHEILSLVSTGLEKAAESCRYRQESLGDLKTGFYSGGCDHIHFTRDGFIYCRSNYEKLSSRQSYWFDNNSLDSSVIIAGQKLFILQGDRSHSLQWEKYGFRLECPRGAVSKDTEVAVTALAGGNFKVPKGTVLVSAVYAISVSKALLKPLVIELQHCVDLRNTCQTGCLKFVRAPLKSPYQFSIVEGGSFRVGKRYGSIKREQFCCMGIVAEMSNGDTPSDSESEEGYETPPEGSTDDTHNDSGNGAGETSERTASPINTGLSQESVTDDSNQKVQKVESTSGASDVSNESTEDEVKQKPNEDKGVTLLYTGMMYYEKKEVNQWMSIFSVVQDLDVLWSYLENEHPEAEKDGPIVSEFKYNEPDGILQLCLQDAPSLESGWTVHPNQSPMQIRQCVVDKFIDDPTCKRSSIHISVYAKPGIAKDPLHCPIELTGIDPSKIIYINRSPPSSSMNSAAAANVHGQLGSKHQNVVLETNAVSLISSSSINIQVANEILSKNKALLRKHIDLKYLGAKMEEKKIITNDTRRNIVSDTMTGLSEDQRMDRLLDELKNAITFNGSLFLWLVELLNDYDTVASRGVANILIKDYNESTQFTVT